MSIRLESPAFVDGGTIPIKYTCDGQDVSPPLSWSNVPDGTRSLLLLTDDPDAPRGTWTHWVIYHLPANLRALPEALPPEPSVKFTTDGVEYTARQGRNDFRKPGYGGPCPPSGTHRYFFHIYALDNLPALNPNASRLDILNTIKGHILAEGRLMGRYSRGK